MEVWENVYKLKSKGCNVYLLKGDGNYLIDTGTPNAAKLILSQIKQFNLKLDGILITHAHFDHVGSAGSLQKVLECPIYVHKKDIPYVLGEKRYKYSGLLGKVASLVENFSNVEKAREVRDVSNSTFSDFSIVHTPGHTPGSICILYKNCLICGDLFRYGKKYHIFGDWEIKLSPKSFCSNYTEYLNSVREILKFDFDAILPGHGLPVYNAKERLKELIERIRSSS